MSSLPPGLVADVDQLQAEGGAMLDAWVQTLRDQMIATGRTQAIAALSLAVERLRGAERGLLVVALLRLAEVDS